MIHELLRRQHKASQELSNLAGMTGAKLTDDELGNVIDEIAKLWPGTYMVKGRYGPLF